MAKKILTGETSGTFISSDKTIKVKLSTIVFEDSGSLVFYCPALDVYGYGLTEKEASDSLKVSIFEFLVYTNIKKTLVSELESLGWVVKKQKRFAPPQMSHLLEINPVLNKIFNTRDFKKLDTQVSIPVAS